MYHPIGCHRVTHIPLISSLLEEFVFGDNLINITVYCLYEVSLFEY